jgi:hypothetical protein
MHAYVYTQIHADRPYRGARSAPRTAAASDVGQRRHTCVPPPLSPLKVSPVPVQTWEGWAQSRCRCGSRRGEWPLAQMWPN